MQKATNDGKATRAWRAGNPAQDGLSTQAWGCLPLAAYHGPSEKLVELPGRVGMLRVAVRCAPTCSHVMGLEATKKAWGTLGKLLTLFCGPPFFPSSQPGSYPPPPRRRQHVTSLYLLEGHFERPLVLPNS